MSKTAVLLISGDAVGGIRRHVHSVILRADQSLTDFFYVHSSVATDAAFYEEIGAVKNVVSMAIAMPILKRPAFNDISNIYRLVQLVRKNGIQVVHGHGAKAGLYARVISLFCKIPSIYTPHGGVLHSSFKPAVHLTYLSVEKILLRLTSLVVVESNYSRRHFENKIGVPKRALVVNYNGVDISQKAIRRGLVPDYLKSKPHGEIQLGVFGRLHKMKGQDIAIEALAELTHLDPYRRYVLNLFGTGPSFNVLAALANRLGLTGKVVFHGEISNPEELMGNLDATVIPSRFESFSYVAAESLVAGTPVVASSVGGLKEVLADGAGVLVEELTPSGFANAIKRLFDAPEILDQMVVIGRRRCASLFDENRTVSVLQELYNELAWEIKQR